MRCFSMKTKTPVKSDFLVQPLRNLWVVSPHRIPSVSVGDLWQELREGSRSIPVRGLADRLRWN